MAMLHCPSCDTREFVGQAKSGVEMNGSSTTSATFLCKECGFSMRVYCPNDVDMEAQNILIRMFSHFV